VVVEFSTGRLEASTRIEERSSPPSAEERRRRAPRRHPDNSSDLAEDELLTLADDELQAGPDPEAHQLDDLA
jgi:hypothetical protein